MRFLESFGLPGDRPAVGDFNSDGFEDLAVNRGGLWFFDTDGQGGAGEHFLHFGIEGDVPLAYHFTPDEPDLPPSQDPPDDPTLPPPDQGNGDGMLPANLSARDDSLDPGLPGSAPATDGADAPLRGADPHSERIDPDLVDDVFDQYDDLEENLVGGLAG